jgi:hypothetical protein
MVACPVCGGDLTGDLGVVFVCCRYCHASVVQSGGQLVARYFVPVVLPADSAARSLRRFMAGNRTKRGLDTESQFVGTDLVWLPLWHARVRKKKRLLVVERRADERLLPEVGTPKLPPAALVRIDERESTLELSEPSISVELFRTQQLAGRAVEELALVHLPYYRIAYLYRGKRATAAVSAVTGEVHPGTVFTKPEWPFRWLTGVVLGAVLLLDAALLLALYLGHAPPVALLLGYPAVSLFGFVVAALLMVLV